MARFVSPKRRVLGNAEDVKERRSGQRLIALIILFCIGFDFFCHGNLLDRPVDQADLGT